ncbi:hypothetical protein LRR18_00765 [Mangrovimonas sp. AS39]|uniref:hypothetical protein n=1 Tax=Mangrovimonas futianensis TaxID=2895523 RepID=UPI001E2F47C0|nr:hypothetical protein [Mangrovimonas futianensis]MCF1190098.1 hypothetical protein [Mangrovimonas futianensis]MCF1194151.1 hypothetical protein [Mangrovimonas futianensis]
MEQTLNQSHTQSGKLGKINHQKVANRGRIIEKVLRGIKQVIDSGQEDGIRINIDFKEPNNNLPLNEVITVKDLNDLRAIRQEVNRKLDQHSVLLKTDKSIYRLHLVIKKINGNYDRIAQLNNLKLY